MIYIGLFLGLLACDMAVKYWASTTLIKAGTIPFIPKILSFTYAENRGAAFSILTGARWFFVISAAVFVFVLSVMFKKNYFTTWWSKLGVVFLASGAVGNAVDRMRYGFVVDMFELKFMNFAIFNVADLFITIGAILLGAYILLSEGKNA